MSPLCRHPGGTIAAGATLAATDEPIAAARNRVARNFFTTDLLGLPEGESLRWRGGWAPPL
jgi:hypothetical protein